MKESDIDKQLQDFMEESGSEMSDVDPDKILSKINQVSGKKDDESEDWGAFTE